MFFHQKKGRHPHKRLRLCSTQSHASHTYLFPEKHENNTKPYIKAKVKSQK